jgi:hypothetical protein
MAARGGVRPTPSKLRNMTARAEGDLPLQNYGTWGRGGYRPNPSESRNGGTVTYHPWQRNATLLRIILARAAAPPAADTFAYQAFCILECIILTLVGLIGPNRGPILEYIGLRLGPRLPYSRRPNQKT